MKKRNKSGKLVKVNRLQDPACQWVTDIDSRLEPWRLVMVKFASESIYTQQLVSHLSYFLKFISKKYQNIEPLYILNSDTVGNEFLQALFEVGISSNFRYYCTLQNHKFFEYLIENLPKNFNKANEVNSEFSFKNPIIKCNKYGDIKKLSLARGADVNFEWMKKYQEFEVWRMYAVEYLKFLNLENQGNLRVDLTCLSIFFDWLISHRINGDPAVFFSVDTILPDYNSYNSKAFHKVKDSRVSRFLEFVLDTYFTLPDGNDVPRRIEGFRNPYPFQSSLYKNLPARTESVRSVLPYPYIDELRRILVQGPNFRDWTWAHTALGAKRGPSIFNAGDWFPVEPGMIDKDDPDCVYRFRSRTSGAPVLEMWSPVRWVAILTLLCLPLRGTQVRLLDDGSFDFSIYRGGEWMENPNPRLVGTPGNPRQQGIFRPYDPKKQLSYLRTEHFGPDGIKPIENIGSGLNVKFFVNTNKTADIGKSSSAKGYSFVWPRFTAPNHMDIHYWIEKLIKWQAKYNPSDRLVRMEELDHNYIDKKTDGVLASYPEASFLFRTPEAGKDYTLFPLNKYALEVPWWYLLKQLENKLIEQKVTNLDGSRIKLIINQDAPSKHYSYCTYFSIHSLRVSLATALALEGKVPYEVLRRILGHSRILMTLYYIKMGPEYLRQRITEAHELLTSNPEKSLARFLKENNYEHLLEELIYNSKEGIEAAISVNPADRNPAGWADMGYGICLCGGNATESQGTEGRGTVTIGGCYNGGNRIVGRVNESIPGGPRNCVRCRWFVTSPEYLPALERRFNNLGYHADEALKSFMKAEESYQSLLAEQYDVESTGQPFTRQNEKILAERLRSQAMAKWNELELSQAACWMLIARCLEKLNGTNAKNSLIAVGDIRDLEAVFTETDSELLQLSQVCEDLEIDPGLDLGKAIVRRSQLLDLAMVREGHPPVLLGLTEDQQLKYANYLMRRMALAANPEDPYEGRRKVVSVIEAGERLSARLGINLKEILASLKGASGTQPLQPLNHSRSKNVIHDRCTS